MNSRIVRLQKKAKWQNGSMSLDMSWDVPISELPRLVDYLAGFKPRSKRPSKK